MRVSHYMTPQPVTLTPEATVAEAAETMFRNDIHELPIVEDGVAGGAEVRAGGVVGIITERDLRALLGPQYRLGDLSGAEEGRLEQRLGEVMTTEVKAILVDDSLGEAARMLADLRVGALPVIDADGALVGILSITDVLAAAASLFEEDE